MLKLALTDGEQEVTGLEYQCIKELTPETVPGCKLLLHHVTCRRGLLILTPGCTSFVGGSMDGGKSGAAANNTPATPSHSAPQAAAPGTQPPSLPPATPACSRITGAIPSTAAAGYSHPAPSCAASAVPTKGSHAPCAVSPTERIHSSSPPSYPQPVNLGDTRESCQTASAFNTRKKPQSPRHPALSDAPLPQLHRMASPLSTPCAPLSSPSFRQSGPPVGHAPKASMGCTATADSTIAPCAEIGRREAARPVKGARKMDTVSLREAIGCYRANDLEGLSQRVLVEASCSCVLQLSVESEGGSSTAAKHGPRHIFSLL